MSKFRDRFKERALSYSQLASFAYNPEEWYINYVQGKRGAANAAMLFGTKVGDSIGTPESLVPSLVPPGVKEFELHAEVNGIPIIGYADHYCPDTKVLHENKTSDKLDRWTQKKVDEHKQLDMYALMLLLRDKVKPEEVHMQLNFIPVTQGGDFVYRLPEKPYYIPFYTKRTTLQVLKFVQEIEDTLVKMEAYMKSKQ